jgi:hypothetical protein
VAVESALLDSSPTHVLLDRVPPAERAWPCRAR